MLDPETENSDGRKLLTQNVRRHAQARVQPKDPHEVDSRTVVIQRPVLCWSMGILKGSRFLKTCQPRETGIHAKRLVAIVTIKLIIVKATDDHSTIAIALIPMRRLKTPKYSASNDAFIPYIVR